VALATPLRTSRQSRPIVAVLGYRSTPRCNRTARLR
jgi:hypothetical protein